MTSKTFLLVLAALLHLVYGCTSSSPQGDGSVKEVMVNGNKVFHYQPTKLKICQLLFLCC